MAGLDLRRFDHVSVLIADVPRSRHFYGGVLGLAEVPGPKTFDFVVVWYRLTNDQYLHLLLKDAPDTRSPRHFALAVADAAAAREHFREHGTAVEETVPIPGADRFFIHDPDGNRIEIMQWFRPYDPAADGRSLV